MQVTFTNGQPTGGLKLNSFVGPTLVKLHPGVKRRQAFFPFPPHHFLESAPTFASGYELDPERIDAYRIRWEARCVEDTADGFSQKTLRSDEVIIPVKR
jgi:hypothetical protein